MTTKAPQDLADLARRTADLLAARHVGVVVGAVRGDESAVGAAGRTGVDHEGRPDAHTLFEIGSVTKVFTGLALARLALAGTVDLDEPVRALLPAGTAVPSRGGREITLRHLATHTSGLPRLPAGVRWWAAPWRTPPDPYAGYTADVVLAGLAHTGLRATPGDRCRYSNLGAGLLGLALATRTGTDYETLVAADVCQPLGLTDTAITLDAARQARLAQGHTGRRRPVPPWHLAALAGAGGLRSTAADLVTFLHAQLDATTEGTRQTAAGPTADAIRLSREITHPINRWTWTTLGWMGLRLHPRFGSAHQFWHNGGTGGFRSWIGLIPDRRAAVAVLTNTAHAPDTHAFDLLRALAFGGDLNGSSRP
ncbi:CubicO group peptidase, beta-lactamase class C family [Micromonospora nigra]|uniref:CubicO group peptidase, beta-lactamase class C family n=1 Tax=Micromonospora nigra TaxID=145857 RepID=A0A1C6RBF5_9ACTN|nr:serine hydrolase domain-containing protein [Micromonospora nigra]SCL14384.1 CubicO group peptidase, beta-lactamase class C family [Micromonospora nigra]